jgi:hypothetical protein
MYRYTWWSPGKLHHRWFGRSFAVLSQITRRHSRLTDAARNDSPARKRSSGCAVWGTGASEVLGSGRGCCIVA